MINANAWDNISSAPLRILEYRSSFAGTSFCLCLDDRSSSIRLIKRPIMIYPRAFPFRCSSDLGKRKSDRAVRSLESLEEQ